MKTKITFLLLFTLMGAAFAQKSKVHSSLPDGIACNTCHSCEVPTKENPCIKSCPREMINTVDNSTGENPENVFMKNKYSETNLYLPINFSHKAHSEMADMSGGCSSCHHYNPKENIVGCKECHEINRLRADLTKPDLKGAYHRLCMDCHKAWGGSIDCGACHELQSENQKQNVVKKTPIPAHKKAEFPAKIVFESTAKVGKLVTFFHKEHIDLFGMECGSCHRNDNCINCHQTDKSKITKKKTAGDFHKICSKCHDTQNNCTMCHSNIEKKPFDHELRTGFALKRFHNKLACTRCHVVQGKFTGRDKECISCHGEWSIDNFDHKVTGLQLDDTHKENDCESCHVDKTFSKIECSNCHDEEIKYPKNRPGKLVSSNK